MRAMFSGCCMRHHHYRGPSLAKSEVSSIWITGSGLQHLCLFSLHRGREIHSDIHSEIHSDPWRTGAWCGAKTQPQSKKRMTATSSGQKLPLKSNNSNTQLHHKQSSSVHYCAKGHPGVDWNITRLFQMSAGQMSGNRARRVLKARLPKLKQQFTDCILYHLRKSCLATAEAHLRCALEPKSYYSKLK